jgi:hypothetical protein
MSFDLCFSLGRSCPPLGGLMRVNPWLLGFTLIRHALHGTFPQGGRKVFR